MSPYHIQPLKSDFRNTWNNFVVNHPYSGPLQLWEWGEVKRSIIWEPLRLGIFYHKKLVGSAQILRRRLPLGFNLLYCPRGPVLDWSSPQSALALKSLLGYIKNNYSSLQTLFFRLEPQIGKTYNPQPTTYNLSPYFKSIQPSHTSIIDLTPKPGEIIYNMDKDTRYGIRRAAREGVEVVMDTGQKLELWKAFYEMYIKTAEKGFVPRSWRQFEKTFKLMAPNGQAILFLAFLPRRSVGQAGFFASQRDEHQDIPKTLISKLPPGAQIIAGAIILKTRKQGCYLWGASDITPETKNLYAPYLLQWEIMNSLKRDKVEEYDLWGIAPTDNSKHAWSGHTLFKKGFGGKRVDYLGVLDLPLSPLYRPYRMLDYMRQRIYQPDLIGN
ncbi:peptidoglycan bridge formation glycyltransferase FemA/FemB family protein [Patescibacteria group bacterium]|nr:peptidoglycan bridge formation glycyltransferase FemA/FemB family protein [Patescibacteria group bacterium]